MGRIYKILFSILVFLSLSGIYFAVVPAYINSNSELIERFAEQSLGFKIKIVNLKFNNFLSIFVKADEIAVVNDDGSYAFDLKNPSLNIRVLPLFFRHLSVKSFEADKLNANFVFDKESKFRLGQYVLEPETHFKLTKLRANIKDYDLYIYDEIRNKDILYDGKLLNIEEFIDNKSLHLATAGEVITGSKKSEIEADIDIKLPLNNISDKNFKLSGSLKNFDISDFSEYIKIISKNKIISSSGIINVSLSHILINDGKSAVKTYITADNFGLYGSDLKTSMYSKERISVSGNLYALKNGLGIDNMKLVSEGISTFVSGKINRLDSKTPNLDLKIGINPSKAEKFLQLLPPEPHLSPDINLLVLKRAGFWGDVSGNLDITGKFDYPDVYGNVLVKNAYMVREIPNSKKGTIKLNFQKDKMFLDVNVPTSPVENVWVNGSIILDKERTADLRITSTKNVDLKTAQIVLNPLHDVFEFELGPVPIMDIRGKGGINFHVTGTKKDPHGWGVFEFKDAIVSFLDINNLILTNGSGKLEFNNQDTFFSTQTALIDGKPVSINGTCSLSGNLNFDVSANGQDLSKLVNIVKTSPMLKDIQKMLYPIENASGKSNLKLNLTGVVKDVNDIVFNKNIFAKGSIELFSNSVKLNKIPLANVKGIINFNNFDADFNLNSVIASSVINVVGKIKNDIVNLKLESKKFNLGDGIKYLSLNVPYSKDLSTIDTEFTAKYNGKLNDIEYDKLNLKGKIFSNQGKNAAITVNNSIYELNNSNLKLQNLNGIFNGSPYNLTLNISKLFSSNRIVNGNGKISGFDLKLLNYIKEFLPENIQNIDVKDGNTDIAFRVWNNNYNVYSVLDNISLINKPLNTEVLLKSGSVLLHNNVLNLNKINAVIEDAPVFADGKISNILKNPEFNLYLNMNPTQNFIDQVYNKTQIYPVKIKGDINLTSKISGNLKKLGTKSSLDISENSSLYYMGAFIGDTENPVKITLDSYFSGNKIYINDLEYDKIIMSQNNKPFIKNQLNSSGTLILLSDNVAGFNNLKIKTQNPTDAKIFNLIFRKPFMKQGVFTSDLVLNGTSIDPKIKGTLDITSIDIPLFDSTIRGISLDFKNDKIYVSSKGTVLKNDVVLEAVMRNKLTPAYIVEDINLEMKNLNINKITDAIRDAEVESARTGNVQQNPQDFDVSQLVVLNADISAEKIKVRNVNAENFNAKMKISDKHVINVDDFKFNIAQGNVSGDFKYDLNSNKTDLNVNLENANALVMSEALFDLKGQVYGALSGDFNLSCTGNSNDDCFRTLSGKGNFKISNGRMPKLGSLEYLLKAGNLFKGGITGLSINSLVDLVTPLKTGEFESISGDIHIEKGIADKVNIYSSGSDLNMFMFGSYNIITSVADMKLVGSLSKNITTVFGKIKNLSLNTLFNTIPGVNDSTEKLLIQSDISKIPNIKNATDIYRIFAVEINGDINGTDYVKSFRWVK